MRGKIIMDFQKMRSIPLKNKELISILDGFVRVRTHNEEAFTKYMHCAGRQHSDEEKTKYVSDEYLHEIINMGENHNGFPETMYGHEMRMTNREHQFFKSSRPKTSDEIGFRSGMMSKLQKSQEDIMTWLGCRNNALSAVYPPSGFIAWHNNANAAAWNLIFTYSETGDGYFKYWDTEKKEIVYMHDKPGWQCKAGYFGNYGEPDKLLYHSAATKCWRHTISFCFDRSETSEFMREEIIDEISSE